MVKCTLNYYGQEVDITNKESFFDSLPYLSRFVLTVEKEKNDKYRTADCTLKGMAL